LRYYLESGGLLTLVVLASWAMEQDPSNDIAGICILTALTAYLFIINAQMRAIVVKFFSKKEK